jgi:hypothetical protein
LTGAASSSSILMTPIGRSSHTTPDWTIDQIRSVHVRMHKAEGVLFPAALTSAVKDCDLRLTEVPEKELRSSDYESKTIATLGK